MKPGARIAVKIALIMPVCMLTMVGPFFLADWIEARYGFGIPSVLVLAVALAATYSIYFGVMKNDIRSAEDRWRRRKEMDR